MKNKVNCIYIVDDDPITVFGIKKALVTAVACEKILSFGNGNEALLDISKRLKEKEEIPELIFLDINMPIMDGWTFMEEFHKLDIGKSIRINIVTSSIDPADYEKWLTFKKSSTHFVDFKNKPIFKITAQDIDYISRAS